MAQLSTLGVIRTHFMKTRTQLFLAATIVLSLLAGCKPTGTAGTAKPKPHDPLTTRDLTTLTNEVQRHTTDPIIQIYRVDMENRMMVYTGSTTNQDGQVFYFFEQTPTGWRFLSSRRVINPGP